MVDTPGSLTTTAAGEVKESSEEGWFCVRETVLLLSLSGMFGGRLADSGNLDPATAIARKRRRSIFHKSLPSLDRLEMTRSAPLYTDQPLFAVLVNTC